MLIEEAHKRVLDNRKPLVVLLNKNKPLEVTCVVYSPHVVDDRQSEVVGVYTKEISLQEMEDDYQALLKSKS